MDQDGWRRDVLSPKDIKELIFVLEMYANKNNWDNDPCSCFGRNGCFWTGIGTGPELAEDILRRIKNDTRQSNKKS